MLDREKRASYNLSIAAIDVTHPDARAYCNVTVDISDVSDSPPVFSEMFYVIHVSEATSIGNDLIKVLF